ncbi:hypothetical protein F4775DRAFT_606682 [Biscogniauxia sp. FL1348]|nr:hypothetical protein F4775DRAFT_606682 [Biscogniauxia sp. FL1348]
MSYQQNYIDQGAWPGNASMDPIPQGNQGLDIDEALQHHTNSYRGFIANWDQATMVDRQYKATCNQVDTDASDFPSDEGVQRELVRQIVEAIVNTRDVLEKDTNFAFKKIVDKKYSDIELELVAWKVLASLKSAQEGQNELSPWYCEGGPRYARFESFMDRFNEIVRILRVSKDMVKNIFTNDMFRDRLAWNPRIEYSRKETNRSGNFRKGAVCKIGNELARENAEIQRRLANRMEQRLANRTAANNQGANNHGVNNQGGNNQEADNQEEHHQGGNNQVDDDMEGDDEDINNRPGKRAKRTASQANSRVERPVVNNPRRRTTTADRGSSSTHQPAAMNNPQTPQSQTGMVSNRQQRSPTHQQYVANSPRVQDSNNVSGEQIFSSPQRPVRNVQQATIATPGRQALQTQQPAVVNNGLTFPVPQQPIAPEPQRLSGNIPQNVAVNQNGLTFPAPQQQVQDAPQPAVVNQNGLTFPAPRQSTASYPQNAAINQNGLTFPAPQQPFAPNTPQTAANSHDGPALSAQQTNGNRQQAGVAIVGGLTFPAPAQPSASNPQTPQLRSNVNTRGQWSSPAVPSTSTSGQRNANTSMSTSFNNVNADENNAMVDSSPMNHSRNMAPSGDVFDLSMLASPVNAAGHHPVNYHGANNFNDPENDTSVRFTDAPDVQGDLFGDVNQGIPNYDMPQDMDFQFGQPNNNTGYQFDGARPDFNNQFANYNPGNNHQQANGHQGFGNHQSNNHQDRGNNNNNQAQPLFVDPQLVNNPSAGDDVFMGDGYDILGLNNLFHQ